MLVARSGRAPAGAEPPQVAPAGLPADPAPNALADPGRRSAPAPAVTLRMGTSHRVAQRSSLLLRQQEVALPRPVAPVAHAGRAAPAVMVRELAHPFAGH